MNILRTNSLKPILMFTAVLDTEYVRMATDPNTSLEHLGSH